MERTCIICGGAPGSREHIFPAALGGRRINKGIYCAKHNGDYSQLADVLSKQLKAVNALLGVIGDHAEHAHTIITTDAASARQVRLSCSKSEFTSPELMSEVVEGEVRTVNMAFSSERQIREWVQSRRAQGKQVQLGKRQPSQRYYLSESPISLTLGGSEGLRAIGYVALTFLAHYFPDIARAPGTDAFKAYTLDKSDGDCVWWDFETPSGLPQNTFEFGHRIIVGLDPVTSSIYARISLFSTLHFAVLLGHVPTETAQAVIVDIDPIADHPPNDIQERREHSAVASVTRPKSLTGSLSGAMKDGCVQQSFGELMRRIGARNLALTAKAMLEKLKGAVQMDGSAREKLFATVLDSQSQRILNIMRYVIDHLKASDPLMDPLAPVLDRLVASDPATANGLSHEATAALALARQALLAQMLDDYAHGLLDAERMGLLIGDGPGAAIVGQAILEPIISTYKN